MEIYKGFTYIGDDSIADTFLQTWTWCEQLGGQLPSVHSLEDQSFLIKLVGGSSTSTKSVWLGGRRGYNSVWKWSDGSPLDYTNFNTHYCSSETCCGLRTDHQHFTYTSSYSICDSGSMGCKVCRLGKAVDWVRDLKGSMENDIQELRRNISSRQSPQLLDNIVVALDHINESISSFKLEVARLSDEKSANMTNTINKLKLDTMTETSLRLRLLETALNVSMTLAANSLTQHLIDFKQNATQTEELMRQLRANITSNATAFMSKAENETSSRIMIMDMFLNNSSLTLNNSLVEHSDIVQTVLNKLREQLEQDSEEKAQETNHQLNRMTHRITILGFTILILPIFFVLVMIFRRERGMSKSNQGLALSEFAQ